MPDDIIRKCLAPNSNNCYKQASDLEADLLALDRTSSATSGSRKEDSWLRPPSVTLVEEDSSEALTVIDSFANMNRHTQPKAKTARTRLIGWSCVLLAVAVVLAVFSQMNEPVARDVTLMTLPALDGPWWFDEMPYLIPPAREQLARSEDFKFPRTAAEVRRFKERTNKAVRALSETTEDTVLSAVLENLLKRSVNPDDVLTSIPESLAAENPAWEHTRGNLAHLLGDHQVAEQHYRKALRDYRPEPSGHRGLISLCLSDLARSQAASGRSEDADENCDRALDAMIDYQAPFFRASCLAGRADACRRFEAWEEAERSLLEAKRVLEDAGVESGHPLMTYIHQRFGWLYLDDWKLKDGLHAFTGAIQSRERWLESAADESLSTKIRHQHDEMALAMCQRYAGETDKAIVGYEGVRQELHAMRQRVNRKPSVYREWTNRYYNNSERLGDCYLFSAAGAQQASHHFQQAALDLQRELEAMSPDKAPTYRPQYGRILAKAAIAKMLVEGQQAPLKALSAELGNLELEGNNKTLLDLFLTIGQIIVDSRVRGSAGITDSVARLSAAVEANQDRQFGRDVRELFLVACRELASYCDGENAQKLASVITRLLPRDPVDQSVLPFLRPHFNRLIDLRMRSEEMNWDLLRDIHWAKTGSRLGEDLPKEPIMMFYLMPDAGYLIQFDPNGTSLNHRLNVGF